MLEDAELLRRYAEEKSEEAFTELVRRHLGLVYACALRRVGGDSQLAGDVTQQVFIDVARRAAALARRPVLAGWLFTSTRFAAAKAVRGARRRQQREREAQLNMNPTQDLAAAADWDELRPLLDDALAELDEQDREAVLLRCVEERDFARIGAQLHLTANAARMRVERALEKLRTRLARRGLTSTASVLATALTQQATVALPAGLATKVTSAALAAGAAGSGALAALTFMSMSKLQVGIVGAIVVAGGVGLATQIPGYFKRWDSPPTAAAADHSAPATPPQAASSLRPAEVAEGLYGQPPPQQAGPAHAVQPVGARDASHAVLPPIQDRLRARYAPQYEPLWSQLGLGAAQRQQFMALILARKEAEVGVVNAARQRGDDPNTLEMRRQAARLQEKLETQIGQEFGASALTQYRRHEWLLSATDLVGTATNFLRNTDPLSEEQSRQLVALLAANVADGQATTSPGDPVPYRIRIDDRILQLVSTVARPGQLKPFATIKAAQDRQLAPR